LTVAISQSGEHGVTQNVYDNWEFFEEYSRLGRSVEGLAGAAEWPALRAFVPDLRGLKVVDLGCGFGWFCRWAREQGAAQVLGIDVSEKMLARADSATSDGGITYARADMEMLDLPEASMDLAYSSLAMHYIEDLGKLLATVHEALVPGGQLIFSIEHPIYMAARRPEWVFDADGRKTWPVDSYAVEGPRTTDWLAKGVIKHHRTMGTTLNTLVRCGFAIFRVEEWAPTDDQIETNPELAEERERPMFLLVGARR
jgi:ubiquinone/menaquinone biosynthesis C-methylase UbiE